MPRYIVIGGLSPEVRAAEDLELPYLDLDGFEVGPAITDALDAVAATRRGGGVFGPKGCGKSLEAEVAIDQFHEGEAQKEAADATYRPRRVVVVRAPRGAAGATAAPGRAAKVAARLLSYRAVLLAVLGAILGAAPDDRVRGRRKTDHELLADAAEEARVQGVAVVVIEEAERLAPDGFTALRDLMADAEAGDPGRASGMGGVTGPGPLGGRASRGVRAGGVGVLLIGTPDVRSRLEATEEAGERWAHCETVAGLPAACAPDVFRCFFPAFAEAERLADAHAGAGVWAAGVVAAVAGGRPVVSLRLLENHARNYYRLLVRNQPPEAPLLTRETAPYEPDLFAFAAGRANWHLPAGDPAAAARAFAVAADAAATRARVGLAAADAAVGGAAGEDAYAADARGESLAPETAPNTDRGVDARVHAGAPAGAQPQGAPRAATPPATGARAA